MKLFVQRSGGQLPAFRPAGTVDTAELAPELGEKVARALDALQAGQVAGAASKAGMPDAYSYVVRLDSHDGPIEFEIGEGDLDPDTSAALHELVHEIIRRDHGS